ncbi:MAG: hypothetical protein IKA36_05270 [Clostridia bacterium]|nr:hypothetical protein [Clostridia bacterium]
MYVENRYNIRSQKFLEILAEEKRLRELKEKFPIGTIAWHRVWDQLDKVLKRKKAYEDAVLRNKEVGGTKW